MSYRLRGQISRFCFAKCVSLRRKGYLFATPLNFGSPRTSCVACLRKLTVQTLSILLGLRRDELPLARANIPVLLCKMRLFETQGIFVSNAAELWFPKNLMRCLLTNANIPVPLAEYSLLSCKGYLFAAPVRFEFPQTLRAACLRKLTVQTLGALLGRYCDELPLARANIPVLLCKMRLFETQGIFVSNAAEF